MGKAKEDIKTIIFDIGGVLALGKKEGVHERVIKKLGITIDDYWDSIEDIYSKSIRGKISEKEVSKGLAKNFNIPEKKLKKLYETAYKKSFESNKKLYKFALDLRKKDYNIGILSDQWHLSKKVLVLKKYYKNFDPVFISCDVKDKKPHKEIFEFLLKKLNSPPKNVLFIDDRQWNINAAKNIGIKTILFKNNNQLIKEIKNYQI